jgi:hypothetical protein
VFRSHSEHGEVRLYALVVTLDAGIECWKVIPDQIAQVIISEYMQNYRTHSAELVLVMIEQAPQAQNALIGAVADDAKVCHLEGSEYGR